MYSYDIYLCVCWCVLCTDDIIILVCPCMLLANPGMFLCWMNVNAYVLCIYYVCMQVLAQYGYVVLLASNAIAVM